MTRKNQPIKRNFTFTGLTRDNAGSMHEYFHKTERDSRGLPVKVRQSGMVKTWKTRPNEFKMPVKYGLYQSFYITHKNMHEWAVSVNEI